MTKMADVERRLVAIFAADVEGYSRLMGRDEVGTLRDLTERRQILDGLVALHRGRIANTAGDSVLAEFSSAVDAASFASRPPRNLRIARSAAMMPGSVLSSSSVISPSPSKLQSPRRVQSSLREPAKLEPSL